MPNKVMTFPGHASNNGVIMDIILPTHNTVQNPGLRLTLACLEALYNHTRTPFHLIVVDDSTDITPYFFAEQFLKLHDNVTYVHSDQQFKCGNEMFNIGLTHARSDFVSLIMNSVRAEPGWEIVPLDIMQKEPKVGVIGFKCLLLNETIESAGIKMMKWMPIDIGRGQSSHRFCTLAEPDAVQWAFAMVRKQAVAGNLAEDIFHGFRGWDDIDNCFVLKSKGWRVLYCGVSVGYHETRATRGQNSPEAQKQNQENGERFYKRWGFWEEYANAEPVKYVHQAPKGMILG